MLNRRKLGLGIAAAMATAGSGLAYEAYRGHNLRLSEEPSFASLDKEIPGRTSVIAVRADVPLDLIRTAANQAIPANYSFSGHGPDIGGTINPGGWNIVKKRVSVGTRYEGSVSRGELSMAGSGNTVVCSLPIRIQGKGGLRGDLARMLGLHAKSFRAALILRVRATIDINPDWSPAIVVVPELEWTDSPKVEIATRAWIDVRSHVEGPLRAQLDAMAAKVREAIPRDLIKHEIEKVWCSFSMPIAGAGAVQAWAHIVPIDIGTSGLKVGKDRLEVGVTLKAHTEISTEALPRMELPPLPALRRTPAEPGHLNLAVPIRVAYDAFRTALLAQVGNKEFSTPIGNGSSIAVIVRDVVVYPAGELLAIGVSFEATVPGRLFDANGKVFLTGKPIVENEGTLVRLTEIGFSRQLDNPLWTAASMILEGQIKKAIEQAARVDLAPEIAKRTAEIKAALTDAAKTHGLKVTIRDLKSGIDDIVPASKEIVMLVALDAGIDTELVALRAPKPGSST